MNITPEQVELVANGQAVEGYRAPSEVEELLRAPLRNINKCISKEQLRVSAKQAFARMGVLHDSVNRLVAHVHLQDAEIRQLRLQVMALESQQETK